ncbi:MAG: hypothetical protein KC591_17675, partial [Gemmatimonadetes bacterium]|nr:hypothetical protein [Gemmatimonadota bacterium]
HATSKVWDPQDLIAIATLGFRGEALASIAAVSRVELMTMPGGSGGTGGPEGSGGPGGSGDGQGTRIRLEAGKVVEETRAARARGTTIEVRDLFFNVPARRKFLKTPATEGRVLVRMIGQLALGAPDVSFRVLRDGKRVLEIAAADDFRRRAAALLGDVTRRMVEVKGDREGISVRGVVSLTDFARTRVDHQLLLVNGRPVVDASLAHAVTAGIGGAVPGGKHPIFALAVSVDPSEVDVNVHPTKREVRFTRRDRVFSVIREAVGSSAFATRFDALGRESGLPWVREDRRPRPERFGPAPAAPVWGQGAPEPGTELPFGEVGEGTPREPVGADWPHGAEIATPAGDRDETRRVSTALATGRLRLVGELWGAYLLVEDTDRLLVIDQHAAHERVLYDEIREVANDPSRVPVQGLLVPLPIDLAPGQEPEEAAEVLQAVGFDAAPGGPSTVLVSGIPGNLSRWGGGEFLREVFASAENARANAAKRIDYLAKTYACRAAVKFGQRLHGEEIDHLLRSLERTEVPKLCPHGRPIFLEVARTSLDDRFER